MNIKTLRVEILMAGAMAAGCVVCAAQDAASPASSPANYSGTLSPTEEMAQLRALLAAQQRQLDTLQQTIERILVDKNVAPASPRPPMHPSLGSVAGLTPVIPGLAALPAAIPALPRHLTPLASTAAESNPCEAAPDTQTVPPYLRVGNVCIIPNGFVDLTAVWRDKNTASGLGDNFASVPYNNVTAGKLSEFRLSSQFSRLGFRADSDWKDTHFIFFNEFDFLGNSGTNNLGVTAGAFVPRLRLFWVDARKGRWEVLGGQSWSLLTPNRSGLSPLPSDLFYTQSTDTSYVVGLAWTRQAGIRVVYHAGRTITAGVALENPDQYIGGSGGLSATAVTLPAATALSGIGGTQADNSTNVLNTPNLLPDIIAKIAFDPGRRFHFEAGGIARTFKIQNSATNTASTKPGSGLLVGGNLEIVKNVHLISTNFWSDGGGRYLFGQAPDFIVRANGSISPIHAGGTVDGLEARMRSWLLYGYYGGAYIGRDTALDANGTTKIGYGYANSSNTNNRAIQEITVGLNHTLWIDPRYGAINVMGQYEWLTRDPWSVLTGAPKATHDNTVYMDFRYTLPGVMPRF